MQSELHGIGILKNQALFLKTLCKGTKTGRKSPMTKQAIKSQNYFPNDHPINLFKNSKFHILGNYDRRKSPKNTGTVGYMYANLGFRYARFKG